MADKKVFGILAEFDNPADLLQAAEKLRDSQFQQFDCHSPFPIHGMDRAMGEKRSPLGWIVAVVAFIGLGAGFALEWWTSTIDYPLVISGKPFFSYQAYGPVAFAVMVLSSAFTALIGMMLFNKLPRFHHPLFYSKNISKVSDDGFFVSIAADDPQFHLEKTKTFLESIGAGKIEIIEANDESKKS